MDVTTEAAAGGSEQTSIAVITAEGEGKLSLTDAARAGAGAQAKGTTAGRRRAAPGGDAAGHRGIPLRPSGSGGLVRRSAQRGGGRRPPGL
jgi:hypothetical protein